MSNVEVKHVVKCFGDVTAIGGVDLHIESGEFLVILGPSGCGKTTLMRTIAGLEMPTEGAIWIDKADVTKLPPRLRGIAMVFQSYALYPHMTVANNIAFPLKAQRKDMGRAERDVAIRRAADMVSIGHLLDRKPRQLSGGERQRVAIARAIVTQPKVLLLDEPLSNLDAKLRAYARDELKDFQRDLGITTIFVTHDQIEAMGLGDRIVVMNQGRVQQIGTPQEIYDRPSNTFVATFLGSPSMNILPFDNFDLGFRPENFLPVEAAKATDHIRKFKYHVKRVEFLGSDRLLYGYIDGRPETLLTVSKIASNIDVPIEIDNNYEFAVSNPQLHFFDKKSGQKIEQQAV